MLSLFTTHKTGTLSNSRNEFIASTERIERQAEISQSKHRKPVKENAAAASGDGTGDIAVSCAEEATAATATLRLNQCIMPWKANSLIVQILWVTSNGYGNYLYTLKSNTSFGYLITIDFQHVNFFTNSIL